MKKTKGEMSSHKHFPCMNLPIALHPIVKHGLVWFTAGSSETTC